MTTGLLLKSQYVDVEEPLPDIGSAPYLVQLGLLGWLGLAAGTWLVVRNRRRQEATITR